MRRIKGAVMDLEEIGPLKFFENLRQKHDGLVLSKVEFAEEL